MRALYISLLLVLLVGIPSCRQSSIPYSTPQPIDVSSLTEIEDQLDALGLEVRAIENEHIDGHIRQTFEVFIRQPLDHTDNSKGYFKQKFYLSHSDHSAPMVMYLSGYSAGSNRYLAEPTYMYQANQIHVEHRFFGESRPEEIPYEYLTIAQAAADHHHIVEILKKLYSGTWLNTGISKGGQTTMYHRYFYPEDVDASLVYVAPLNQEFEDERIYDFLANVGEESCRKQVLAYQLELLMNYDFSLELFQRMSEDKDYEYGMPISEAFELSIFEYGFAFWQWNADCASIPDPQSSFNEKMEHLFYIDAPGFFTEKTMTDIYPFFYQSYTEMGMYGYRLGPFKELTRSFTEDVSNYEVFIPEGEELDFSGAVHQAVANWLDTEAEDIAFIYGEYDPWTATGYVPGGKNNLTRYTVSKGNHTSRIAHLPPAQIAQLKDSLQTWMND